MKQYYLVADEQFLVTDWDGDTPDSMAFTVRMVDDLAEASRWDGRNEGDDYFPRIDAMMAAEQLETDVELWWTYPGEGGERRHIIIDAVSPSGYWEEASHPVNVKYHEMEVYVQMLDADITLD